MHAKEAHAFTNTVNKMEAYWEKECCVMMEASCMNACCDDGGIWHDDGGIWHDDGYRHVMKEAFGVMMEACGWSEMMDMISCCVLVLPATQSLVWFTRRRTAPPHPKHRSILTAITIPATAPGRWRRHTQLEHCKGEHLTRIGNSYMYPDHVGLIHAP